MGIFKTGGENASDREQKHWECSLKGRWIIYAIVCCLYKLIFFPLNFVHFYSVPSCNALYNHWKFWPSVLLAQFAETLVNKHAVRRDRLHYARGIVTPNDEGEIKNPSKPRFLSLSNLMKTTHEDNYFLWKYLEPTLCFMSEGKGLFSLLGPQFGLGGWCPPPSLKDKRWKPLSCQVQK